MDRNKKEKKKKIWKEFNKEREREKNCSINQVMRGKGIAFNDIFLTVRFKKKLRCKKCVTFVKLHQA